MFGKSIRIFLTLGLIISLCGLPALAQVAYQPVGIVGGIDYSKRVFITKGIGMPGGVGGRGGQIRAAIIDAQRNYLEQVAKGAYLDATSTVENLMLTNDKVVTKVRGVVQNFTVVDTQYIEDGSIEVTLQFNMAGDYLDAVLPQDMGMGAPTPPPSAAPAMGKAYTGLIVDARGLGVRPALAPKVLDTQGKEVYGSSYVSREYAVQQGMVGYAKDPDKASASDRVAPMPFLVKGIQVEGPNKTDVVISDEDASTLLSMSENLSFLRQAKVVILVD